MLYTKFRRRLNWIQRLFINIYFKKAHRKIATNLKYKPLDKSRFEIAKFYAFNHETNHAKDMLIDLIQSKNCDWRICYRSLAILAIISKSHGQDSNYQNYKDLCLTSNPQFPIEILEKSIR